MLFYNSCLEEVFLSDVRFFEEKSALTECSPELLTIWNKELEGLESELFKELKTSSEDMWDLVDILKGVSK